MKWPNLKLAAILGIAAPLFGGAPLTLEAVLQRAVARSAEENNKLAVARANQQYLQAQSKTHWDLHPQLGLLGFTNPALLAASLGSSLLMSRQPPSAFTMQNAHFDEMEAAIAVDQSAVQTQMEAARRFFDALAKQKTREELAQLVQTHNARQDALKARLRPAQATTIDLARLEVEALDFESQFQEAKSAYNSSVLSLAAYVDLDLEEEPGEVQLVDPVAPMPADELQVPSATALIRFAMEHRPELQRVRDELEALEKPTPGPRRIKADSASIGYSHVGETIGNLLGLGSSGYLLGGNTGQTDFGLTIRLRDTGEAGALTAVSTARARGLRLELREMEDSISWEIRSIRSQVSDDLDRSRMAERKVDLLEKIWNAVVIREKSGLESPEAVASTEMDLLRSRLELYGIQGQSKTQQYHLQAICGLNNAQLGSWNSLTERNPGR